MPPAKRSARTRASRPAARTRAAHVPPQPSSRICSHCGRSEPCAPGGVPPGWTVTFEAGRTQFLCIDCSRANIRAIEGKLPEEYWE
jgi:hypothetical protein